MNPIESSIYAKLMANFQPEYLQVTNESYMHSVPPGSESHFKVVLCSAGFVGKRQVQRHQAVYACLAQELREWVHALALHTFSPEEWANTPVPDSPQCMGGTKRS